MAASRRTEQREVRADDPALSDEANARLTDELRAAVGETTTEVPVGTPRFSKREHRERVTVASLLIRHRIPVFLSLAVLVVVAGIVSFSTDSIWALPIAVVLHAVGTFAVLGLALQLTSEVEHASPETAARLEQEGVTDPDALLTEMAQEFTSDTADQRGAGTPSAEPTAPSGGGPVLRLLPPTVVAGSVLVAGAVPLIVGTAWLWIVPAFVWPAAALWLVMMRELNQG